MSGTFNYAPGLTLGAWKEYLFSSLNSTWSITRHSMIFNLMISEQAKITPQSISYIEKEAVINFCQKNRGNFHIFFLKAFKGNYILRTKKVVLPE